MSAEYEYKIVHANHPDKLVIEITKAAAEGWEPINAYKTGYGSQDAALLRRRLTSG